MKYLLIALTLILSGCGVTPYTTAGITEVKINKAIATCKGRGGVNMVTQSIGTNYSVFCRDSGIAISI